MTVKEYLEQVERYNKRIQYKLSEVYRLKILATSISAVCDDDVRVQSSGGGDKMANAVARLVDKEREVDQLVADYIEVQDLIIKQIEELGNIKQSTVLYERYVEQKPWDNIAIDLDRSQKQVFRIHGEALAKFEEKYKDFIEMS